MSSVDMHKEIEQIAIVGMACRLPGARNVNEFWQCLKDGVESIRQFTLEELKAPGVDEDALKAIASYSLQANEKTEDIGARRLHTVMEKILEEISFSADEHSGEKIIVDEALVKEKIGSVVEDEDTTRYIL